MIPVVPRAEADQGAWVLLVPLLIAGSGLGLLVSQLNNYTLAPIEEERASEAAGVNSAGGNFGLSFGLAVAGGIMLAAMSLSFTALTNASTVIPEDQKQTIATALEENAEIVSDTQLQTLIADEPPAVQAEILAINDQARALSLQVAMLVPVLACLLGFINAFRMVRLPDIEPSSPRRPRLRLNGPTRWRISSRQGHYGIPLHCLVSDGIRSAGIRDHGALPLGIRGTDTVPA